MSDPQPIPLKKTYFAYFLLIVTTLFWSSNIVVGRSIYSEVSPISLAFWRWFTASLIILPFGIRYFCNDWKIIIQHWRIIVLLSLLGVSVFNTILYYATHSTAATNIALIQTSMPLFVVLISFILFSHRISINQMVGVMLGMWGAFVVIFKGSFFTFYPLQLAEGDLIMLLAVFAYALYSVLLPRAPKVHQLSFLLSTFAIGTVFLLPFYVWENTEVDQFVFNDDFVMAILYLAVFPSILSYLFWNHGVATIGAHTAGLFICFIPIFTALIAAVYLGEELHLYHLTGMLMILVSVIITHKSKI